MRYMNEERMVAHWDREVITQKQGNIKKGTEGLIQCPVKPKGSFP